MTQSTYRSGTIALAGAAVFVALVLVLHVVRSDLEPGWHMVSEYSVGPGGWLMRLAFVTLAGSFFFLMLSLRPHARGALGVAGRVFLGLASVGAGMAGLFNTDPPGTPPEQSSTIGMLHGFAFLLGVPGVLFAVTLLTSVLWRSPGWRSQRPVLLGSAALVWATMLVFGRAIASAMASHATGPAFAVGWQNRALVLAWALWIGALAAHARTAPSLRGGSASFKAD
ncbi:MAG TPA: DUF998 domain-containing protein [Polyangiaceae bacterium]